MKKLIYKPGLLLITSLFALSSFVNAQQVTREFHKEYTAGSNTTLDISNRYGSVVVETGDQNKVIIDVKVTVELPNRDRAEKLLSYIDVRFSEGNNLITAKTIIDDKFNFTGWTGESKRFSINYVVKMPVNINFTLSNRYGNTELDEISGLVKLDIKYGNLTAANLSRGNEKPINSIIMAYGKAEISRGGWFDITSRYSGSFVINKCQAVLLDSKYSKIQIGEAGSLVGESKYDNLKIEKINNVVLDGGYCDVNIGTLSRKLKYDGGYGSFTVDEISAGFESIETDTRYIGVNLGIDRNASYKLDARLSYGNLKFDEENFTSQRRIIENNSNETSGVVGKESSPSATVMIRATYGTVRLE